MKVDNTNQLKKDYAKLQRDQEKKMSALAESHNQDMGKLKVKNITQYDQEKVSQEDKIKQLYNQLERTEEALNTRKEFASKSVQAAEEEMQSQHAAKSQWLQDKAKYDLAAQQENYKEKVSRSSNQQDLTLSKLHNQRKEVVNDIQDENVALLKSLNTQFKEKLNQDQRNYIELSRQQKTTQQQNLANTQKEWNQKIQATTQSSQQEMQRLKSQVDQSRFKQKEQLELDQRKNQEVFLKNYGAQKTSFDQKISSLEAQKLREYTVLENKSADAFYQPTKVIPALSETPTEYRLTLSAPEHEQGNYLLSGNERTLSLSFNRQYKSTVGDAKEQHQTSRVESYVTKFPVEQIINPKNIEKKYANNILTFIVKKA
jgi:HSP20 family molecular chaperone IbpA